MDNNKIGKFIASLRKEQGLTQKELGDKLFVTDKAVSKWERGLSLPDITLLKSLSKELNAEITEILDGKRGTTRKINIEEELQRLTKELKLKQRKSSKKILLAIIILILIIVYITFKNLYLGYNIKNVNYYHTNKNINLGIPKTSFMMKHNDRSYSFKNIRNSNIIENEVKKYLKTLKYSNCNNTIYYYNEKDNFSIINYSIKNNLLYSTISYEVVENDYCYTNKLNEYTKKLGGLKKMHTLNGGTISLYENWDSKVEVVFMDGYTDGKSGKPHEFKANLRVYLYKRKDSKNFYKYTLEDSVGNFEIKGNKLYYYRTDISEKADNIEIPEVSVFKIESGKLILTDNYLAGYEENIILK